MFDDLTVRKPALEEMDKPDIAPEALEGALRSLARINTIGNSAGIVWPALRKEIEQHQAGAPLRVLDVGCGGGDLPRRLERWAQRAGYPLQVDGCDMSPVAVAMAQRDGDAAGCRGQFYVLDAIHEDPPETYDVVLSSLFLHHLDDAEAVMCLRRMAKSTKRLLLVSDLLRSRFGLLLVHLATRALTRSPVVHQDGLTSLRAAYTLDEVRARFAEAGLQGAQLSRHWPERFLAAWRPDIVRHTA